jgi:hypothetical protein
MATGQPLLRERPKADVVGALTVGEILTTS